MPNGYSQLDMIVALAPESVKEITANWPRQSRRVADKIFNTYGLPHEATSSMLIWQAVRPWKRIVVYRDGTPHNFPRPHLDLLEQTIDYRVPLNKHDDLAAFDGSILIDRTRGEISVRCNSESMNKLVLNLAHDIVMNKRDVAEARNLYTKATRAIRMNWSEPYTQQLQFATGMTFGDRESYTSDPDHKATVA